MKTYCDIDQIVSTTHATMHELMKYKNWGDCIALYFRYIEQRKIQENSQTLSKDSFMQKAMGRGEVRLRNAKKILFDLGLVEKITKRWSDGKILGHYIKVNFIVSKSIGEGPELTTTLPDHAVATPLRGGPRTNTLIVKKNTLVVNWNTEEEENSEIPLVHEEKKIPFSKKEAQLIEIYETWFEPQDKEWYRKKLDTLGTYLKLVGQEKKINDGAEERVDEEWVSHTRLKYLQVPDYDIALTKALDVVDKKEHYDIKDFRSTLRNWIKKDLASKKPS